MTPLIFVTSYLLLMLPTYLVRLEVFRAGFEYGQKAVQTDGSIVSQLDLLKSENDLIEASNSAEILLVVCYLGLVAIAVLRGVSARRRDLFAYPLVAGVFDVLIPFVPLAPTIMHLIAITRGVGENEERADIVGRIDRRRIIQSFRWPDTTNWKLSDYAGVALLTFGVALLAFTALFVLLPAK